MDNGQSPERRMAAEFDVNQCLSPQARRVLEEACFAIVDAGERKRTEANAQMRVKILSDFLPEITEDRDSQYLFDAALLSAFADERGVANGYFQGTDEEDSDANVWNRREDVAIVLGDTKVLKGTIESMRERLILPMQDELFDSENGGNSKWQRKYTAYDSQDIYEITQKVSPQSFVLAATQLLQRTGSPDAAARTDEEVLKDIIDVETFYAPVCEVIGYDGLAMTLRHFALLSRFEKMGMHTLIEEAQEFVNTMFGKEGVRSNHKHAMQAIIDTPDANRSLAHNSGIHFTEFGTFKGTLLCGEEHKVDVAVKGTYRIKTIGSLIEKILELQKEPEITEPTPMDLFGMTIVVKDEAEVATVLRGLVDRIENSRGRMRYRNSPKRKHAVQIRGDDQYVKNIASRAKFGEVLTEFKRNEDPDDYEVSKVTFEVMMDGLHYPVRTEVQILTKDARRISRRGYRSHMMHGKTESERMSPEAKRQNGEYLELIYDWGRTSKESGDSIPPFATSSIANGRAFQRGLAR